QIVKTDPWRVARCVMSTASLARCGDNVLAAWETEGQIRLATLMLDNSDAKVISMPGESKQRKHPAIAVNAQGERLLVWAEGTGWEKGGDVACQFFHANGEAGGTRPLHGVQPWRVPAARRAPDRSSNV